MSSERHDDPVYRHTRREAIVIASVWLLALLWAVPYCYLNGYHPVGNPAELQTIWGIPNWVFWGIAFPWLVCDVIAIGLCLFYIRDDELGEAHEDADVTEDRRRLHEHEQEAT